MLRKVGLMFWQHFVHVTLLVGNTTAAVARACLTRCSGGIDMHVNFASHCWSECLCHAEHQRATDLWQIVGIVSEVSALETNGYQFFFCWSSSQCFQSDIGANIASGTN